MADSNDRMDELEQNLRMLEHRMYQVEDALKSIQAELSEMQDPTGSNEVSRH